MRATWAAGQQVIKCIGFDATEDHRMQGGGTYATGKFNICPRPDLPAYKDRYEVHYPLRERGYDRDRCMAIIRSVGLPVPPKSACFFCPAMRKIEIERLRVVDPDYYRLALAMEEIYRSGKHYRGDTYWTVKGKHKATEVVYEEVYEAADSADARSQFRSAYDDIKRPYQYELDTYPAVPGLGRDFAWGTLPMLTVL